MTLKSILAAIAVTLTTASAHATVYVFDYEPNPGVRLRLFDVRENCKGQTFSGQFTHVSGYSIDMCWTRDPVSRRILVFYPDGVKRAFASEDLRFVAEVK